MEDLKNKFKLIKIIDCNSPFKTEEAKKLVKKSLKDDYDIEYVYDSDLGSKCKNNVIKKVSNKDINIFETRLRGKDEVCNHLIMDIFVIKNNETYEKIDIGNNCISLFVLNDVLSNVNSKDFKKINKLLSIKRLCLFCNRSCTKIGFHKKCYKGTGKKYKDELTGEDIIKYNKFVLNLKVKFALDQVKYLFGGITFIYNCINSTDSTKKTLSSLYEFIEEYKYFIDNQDILLSYENNRIINSVKKQRRKPSVKQKLFLEKLIVEYDRMIYIDKKNINNNYKKYGYVY